MEAGAILIVLTWRTAHFFAFWGLLFTSSSFFQVRSLYLVQTNTNRHLSYRRVFSSWPGCDADTLAAPVQVISP